MCIHSISHLTTKISCFNTQKFLEVYNLNISSVSTNNVNIPESLFSGSFDGAAAVVCCSGAPGTDCWAKFLRAAAKECEPWDWAPGPGPGTACPVLDLAFVEPDTFGLPATPASQTNM